VVIVDVPSGDRRIIRAGPCEWADWAAVGGRLAVSCGSHVEILSPAGVSVSKYDVSGELHGWSPDGQRFAVSSWRAPLTVYDGSRWFGLDTHTRWFRWLVNGDLAVVSQPSEREPATVRVLRATAGFPILLERQTRPGVISLATSVSPDGRFTAYGLANPDSRTGNYRDGTVILMELASGVEVAVFTASAASYPNAPLEFAPDSTNVLVQTDVCKAWNLAVAGVDGALRQVASGGFWVVKYSPDGKLIGFTRGTELWTVRSDGSAPARRIATDAHGPAGFEWSPDGRWLAVPDFFGGFGACE
jgi:dipeptidyl aminopeptidase/acylaminoacyl peptidase